MATQALRRKKAAENQLDQLAGQRLQLEMQVNTIESANLNAETMMAMKKGSDALKAIHGNMSVLFILIGTPLQMMAAVVDINESRLSRTIDKVDATIEAINAQREIANEISEAISNPMGAGLEIDDVSFLYALQILHLTWDRL